MQCCTEPGWLEACVHNIFHCKDGYVLFLWVESGGETCDTKPVASWNIPAPYESYVAKSSCIFSLGTPVVSAMRGTTACMQWTPEDVNMSVSACRTQSQTKWLKQWFLSSARTELGLGKISQAQRNLLLRFLLPSQELAKQNFSCFLNALQLLRDLLLIRGNIMHKIPLYLQQPNILLPSQDS